MTRHRLLLGPALALALAGCCADGKCIKDPPCRACENPLALTPIQRKALEGKTHALPAPVVYLHEEKTYILFTEDGKRDFEKNPDEFAEKGAIRLIRAGKSWRVDINPGDDVDLPALGARAVPYVPAPK